MKRDRVAVVVIVVYIAALFYPMAFGKIPFPADTLLGLYHPWRDVIWDGYTTGVPYRNFLTTDPMRQTYPWRELAMELWKSGEVPLWNPYSFTGMPLMANVQSGVFYPLNILFLLGEFSRMWGVLILLTPLLSLLFFYAWIRNRGVDPISSLLAALSFSLGGFMMGWMTWGTLGHVALWLPLMLLAIDRLNVSKKRRFLLVYVFASVSSLFAGHLQTAAYVQVVAFVYAWLTSGKLLRSLLLVSIPLLIGSIQLIPTLELIMHSARSEDLAGLSGFLPYKHLVMFLIPDFFGNPATGNYWGEWNYLEFIGYVGIIPLWFAFYALCCVRTRLALFAASLVGVSLVLATNNPLAHLLTSVTQAAASRLLFVTDFGLALLAGLGMHAFRKQKRRDLYPWFILVALFGVVKLMVLYGVVTKAMWVSHLSVVFRNSVLPAVLFGVVSLATFIRPRLEGAMVQKLMVILLVITAIDLGRSLVKFTPFSKASWVYPDTKALSFLKNDPEQFRIMVTDRRLVPPNVSVAYRLESIEGYDPLYLFDYARYVAASEQGRNDDLSLAFHRIITPSRLDIDLPNKLNAKYVLSLSELNDDQFEKVLQEGETRVYQNKAALPRLNIDKGQARFTHYSPNKTQIAVSSAQPATLILRDPASFGWHAQVDEAASPIQKVDRWFRAVSVPPGEHMVSFTYWPGGLTLGILGTAAGILLLEVALWKKLI